jgi:hypothetical protein
MRVRRDSNPVAISNECGRPATDYLRWGGIMGVYGVRVRPERADMKKLSIGMALGSVLGGSVFAAELPVGVPV